MFEQSKLIFGLVKLTPYYEAHIHTQGKIFVEDDISAYEYSNIRVRKCSALSQYIYSIQYNLNTRIRDWQKQLLKIPIQIRKGECREPEFPLICPKCRNFPHFSSNAAGLFCKCMYMSKMHWKALSYTGIKKKLILPQSTHPGCIRKDPT